MGFFKRLWSNESSNKSGETISFSDAKWKAKTSNGTVFCVPTNSSVFPIGTYKRDNETTYTVFGNNGYIIGTLTDNGSSCLIHLSRVGMLKKFEDLGFPRPLPNNLVFTCAEAFLGHITDLETSAQCASYNGSDYIGAAAAFICMEYEIVDNSKYHAFFRI